MFEVEYYKNGCGIAVESYFCGIDKVAEEVSGLIDGTKYDYAIVNGEDESYVVEADGKVCRLD